MGILKGLLVNLIGGFKVSKVSTKVGPLYQSIITLLFFSIKLSPLNPLIGMKGIFSVLLNPIFLSHLVTSSVIS